MKIFSVLCFFASTVAMAAEVTDIQVKCLDEFGGDTSSVVSRCQTKIGQEYSPVTLVRDVTSLRDSNEFEEISADAEPDTARGGVLVVFSVKRKMRYQAPMIVRGNDEFGESKVASEAELKDGYLYGEGDIAAAAQRVRAAYVRKYYLDAKVTPTWRVLSGNDVEITFTIDEGTRQKVKNYVFEGCFSIDEEELHEAIQDYPWWNPMGWFINSPTSEEELAQCCTKVEEVYRNHGFLDVKCAFPTRIPAGEGRVNMAFEIDEGTQYKIGSMKIVGVTRYSSEDVYRMSELPALGSIAGEKDLEDAGHRVKVTVGSGDSGLADTLVEVQKIPGEGDTLDVVFKVTEGVPVVINDVEIRGNDYTMDKVIRREIALGPGDRMLEDRAERSQRRLENLDYFTRVRYYLETADKGLNANGEEYRNLVYEVEEKNTGNFMVGIGASSIDSVYVQAEVSQSNFDLFAPGKWWRGAGQKGRAYVQVGPRIQTYEVSVTEPYFLERQLELTVEAYRRGRWYDDYDIYRTGAGVTLSYPMKLWPANFWPTDEKTFGRFGIRGSVELVSFDDIEHGMWTWNGQTRDWLAWEQSQYDDAIEATMRLFWSRDTRDNVKTPTKGSRTQLFVDLTGGDNSYIRPGFNYRGYWKAWKRYNHTLTAGVRLETILGDDIPIYDRMFLGGPRTIRGVEYRHVSPFAKAAGGGADGSIPWGGQTLWLVNAEYTIPIVKMLRMAVFSDLGAVGEDEFDLDFSDNFAWSVGLGLRIDIPMFPIRLDFGFPVVKPDDADREIFSFMVGYDF